MSDYSKKSKVKMLKSKKWWKILLVFFLMSTAIVAIGGGSYMIIETQKTPNKSIIS